MYVFPNIFISNKITFWFYFLNFWSILKVLLYRNTFKSLVGDGLSCFPLIKKKNSSSQETQSWNTRGPRVSNLLKAAAKCTTTIIFFISVSCKTDNLQVEWQETIWMPSASDLGKNINFNASESSSNGDPSEIRQLENPGLFKGTWTDTHFMTLLLM